MRLREKVVKAIETAGGYRILPAPKRYVAMEFNGDRLWIGKLGAIRKGPTIREAKRRTGRIHALRHENIVIATGAFGGWDDLDYGYDYDY